MTRGATLDDLLEASPTLRRALPGLDRAARSDAPLLLVGEPGTGKSTLARACHAASPRAHGPLVEVDPAATPATLFESDLFGYRAGAFTGAAQSRPGRVRRAQGGTLVLDRVELLPAAAQPKLLRLLAEQRYTPLGGQELAADVRFVALGAHDLPRRVDRGLFRKDLYYRLEVLAFRVPPLRDRRRDLGALCRLMLGDLCRRFERPAASLSPAARAWMDQHDWPGNLRELRNVLERALVAGDGPQLDPPPPRGRGAEPVSLATLERDHLLRVLAYTRGHQGRAADLLGISRKALWEKRKRHGLP